MTEAENSASQTTKIRWQHYTGILLLSMGTLLLELTLIRVLSVSTWYHFGFLVISTALLGFGVAGVTLSLWTRLRDDTPLDRALAALALLFAFFTLASFWLMQQIPFSPFRLILDPWQLIYTPLYYVTLALPFFCSGLAIALLLSRGGREVNKLYGADLLGAGLGCAGVAAVMPIFRGSGSVVIAAMVGLSAALAFSSFRPVKVTLLGGLAAAGMLLAAFLADQTLPIRVIAEKTHPLKPEGSSPIYTQWNAFSKVDVYNAPVVPREGRSGPGFSIIIDDGSAGTAIPDLSMGVRNFLSRPDEFRAAGLPYIGRKHPRVLIIGSGAGREVLEATKFGASSVTAVEINPIVADIVSSRMAKQWGDLFEQPEVQLVVEDARTFVRRSKETYDVIISVNTISQAAVTSGALSLTESYIMTLEAFEDYWKHLSPNGALLVTRPGPQLPRVVATARQLFERLGQGSLADHLLAFSGLLVPYGPERFMRGILLQKSPLRPEQVDTMARHIGVGQDIGEDEYGSLPQILYSPFDEPKDAHQTLLSDLVKSADLETVYASNPEMLRPVTDDNPFFNQDRRWSHLGPRSFAHVFGAGERGYYGQPIAQVTLVILLIQAVLIAGVMILFPLARFERHGLRVSGRWGFLTYFASLGLGFIFIEIVLLQRLQLFLGQPIYTYSVVLASLLVFTGAGSYLADRIESVSHQKLCYCLLAVVGVVVVTELILPSLLALALGLPLFTRVGVAVIAVAPLGLALGVPFPTGLRLVRQQVPQLVPWAWAVNGFFTVIGSIGAMILGMILGFTAVFFIAAACYAAGLLAIRMTAKRPARIESRSAAASS
jgi:SAM-dependent methyltransferase